MFCIFVWRRSKPTYLPIIQNLNFQSVTIRSSRPEVFFKKGVLRNFAKLTGKHLCQSLPFNKVAGFRHATLLKKRLLHRCFPVNLRHFSEHLFLQRTSGGCFWWWKTDKRASCDSMNKLSNFLIDAVHIPLACWIHFLASICELCVFLKYLRVFNISKLFQK